MPSQASVLNKSWPYARPTFYYTNGEPQGMAKKFIDFTLGPGGQSIVNRVGFVSIR
jgi:phosphate transport system substrate-binding protein